MAEKKEIKTFESALARLEVIVKTLEGGDFELDKSLELFEEGVSLVKFCNSKLDSAEKKVQILLKDEESGELVCEPFEQEK
ncbi:MAG: exodeoxyribonuclease VII small subunit [Clostridia bacterium]|nr:exodeoxyribonuclease VII small subunit [Clostridia bacterium]